MNKLVDIFIIRSWWVTTFLLVCFVLYEKGMQKRTFQFEQLQEQLAVLQQEKKKVLMQQAKLQMQVNSQSDLAWIELTLMKGLGVCPEDQKKVYFSKEDEKH